MARTSTLHELCAYCTDVPHGFSDALDSWFETKMENRFAQIHEKLDSLLTLSKRGARKGRPTLHVPNPMGVRASVRVSGAFGDSMRSSTRVSFLPEPECTPPTRRCRGSDEDDDKADGVARTSWPATETPIGSRSNSKSTFDVTSPKGRGPQRKTMSKSLIDAVTDSDARGSRHEFRNSVRDASLHSQLIIQQMERDSYLQYPRGRAAAAFWRFLENPYSSIAAWLYSVFIPIFVLTSVGVSFFQTVKNSPVRGGVGTFMQAAFESVYAVELIIRFIVCPDRRQFFLSIYNWIDLVSALPLVLRMVIDRETLENDEHASTHWAKAIVVAVPLMRLLKIIRRFEKFQILVNAFSMASEALPVLLYTLMLIALFFSVIIYFIEPVDNIGSLPTSLWFIMVTMTTVGYGDITPETSKGRAVILILMIISSLYMAIPIGIVGHAFSQAWNNRDRLLLMHRMRESFLQEGFTAEAIVNTVYLFDQDGDGELDLEEFREMLSAMNVNISEERIIMLHDSIDRDGGGGINVRELIDSLFPGYLAAHFSDDRILQPPDESDEAAEIAPDFCSPAIRSPAAIGSPRSHDICEPPGPVSPAEVSDQATVQENADRSGPIEEVMHVEEVEAGKPLDADFGGKRGITLAWTTLR